MLYLAQAKAPGATINYSFEWADWLSSGASISTSSWAADTGLTVGSGSISGTRTFAPVSGGTNGHAYRFRNTVTASNGEIDTREGLIVVGPLLAPAVGIQADLMLWRLAQTVPQPDLTTPLPEVYEQAVSDAVFQLAQDAPLLRMATLSIVAGQATYDLPSDFLYLISLSKPISMDGVLFTSGGLVPLSANYEERYQVAGGQITFTPTPTYSMSRSMRYAAFYPLDAERTYATLTANAARVALLYAQSLVMSQQANGTAGSGWKYQIGDEMVDKSGLGKGLATQASELQKQYGAAVKQLKGYGGTAQYSAGTVF